MKLIILAAGKGSRLGDKTRPKPLTPLANKQSILGYQISIISEYIPLKDVMIVVGYKKEMIMDAFPDPLFVYNPDYAKENTSKSLLRALQKVEEGTIWMNGDVVFHPKIFQAILHAKHTSMVVNESGVDEESVKYKTGQDGNIIQVSKEIHDPEGEALGINYVTAKDLGTLRACLEECRHEDYFEKGIEKAIQKGVTVAPIKIESDLCTEIDFLEDLRKANQLLSSWKLPI